MRFFRFLVLSFMLLLVAGVMQGQDTSPHVLLVNASFPGIESDRYGSDLFAYDIDHSALYRVTPINSATEYDFSLAPDGRRMVLSIHSGTMGQLDVLQLDDDGTATQLWNPPMRLAWNNAVTIWDDAAWSPVITNGTATLAYTTNSDHERDFKEWRDTDIWLIDVPLREWQPEEVTSQNLETTPLQKEVFKSLRRLTRNDDCNESDLAWSPDGKQLAFVCDGEIYTLDTDGIEQNVRRLTSDFVDDRYPTFSPDGEWLAFSSTRSGRADHDIYKLNLKTGELVQLTTSWTDDVAPAWSPDGATIVFSAGNMITLMQPDGTGIDVLFQGAGASWVAKPEWVLRAPQIPIPPEP
jgi:Tol biopolymer transport system component